MNWQACARVRACLRAVSESVASVPAAWQTGGPAPAPSGLSPSGRQARLPASRRPPAATAPDDERQGTRVHAGLYTMSPVCLYLFPVAPLYLCGAVAGPAGPRRRLAQAVLHAAASKRLAGRFSMLVRAGALTAQACWGWGEFSALVWGGCTHVRTHHQGGWGHTPSTFAGAGEPPPAAATAKVPARGALP